jgi:ferritin-like metal-binding protein YciE
VDEAIVMKMESLKELYVEELQDLYSAETQITKALREPRQKPQGQNLRGHERPPQGRRRVDEGRRRSEVLDAGLISAAQRVEHYEMAGYGTVRTYAELLGEDDAVALLETTLKEEKAADSKLSKVANKINMKANKAA